MARPDPPQRSQYLTVMGTPDFIIARVPWAGAPWRRFITALTPVAHAHGVRAKDLHLDGLLPMYDPPTEADRATQTLLEAAFAGDPIYFATFHLYDWRDGAFVLVRSATPPVLDPANPARGTTAR